MNKIKSVLIGSVGSSKTLLEEMIKIKFPLDLVFSLDEKVSEKVSNYYPLHDLAEKNGIPFKKFEKINDLSILNEIKKLQPDYIFVIGLSQLIKEDLIELAKIGTIGFHPTALPKYRGRAAIPWQIILEEKESKCSLFFIDKGMDSGDIIGQESYSITSQDYAEDVLKNCHNAFKKLIKKTLPKIMNGEVERNPQNEEEATYLLKRTIEDGEIDWDKSCEEIQKLIRATSKPYPGAYSFYKGIKTIFWRAEYIKSNKYIGIPGQIAVKEDDILYIVCKTGLLKVTEYELSEKVELIVGNKFR